MDDETKNGTNDEVAGKSELEVALESDDKTDHIFVHEKLEIFNEEEGNDAVVIMRDKHEESHLSHGMDPISIKINEGSFGTPSRFFKIRHFRALSTYQ